MAVADALESILDGEDVNKALGLVAPKESPVGPKMSAKALPAARREMERWLRGHPPLTRGQLTKLVGVSKTMITRWRRDPRYEQAKQDEALRLEKKRLEERERDRLASIPTPKRNMEQLDVDAHNNWTGSAQCMVCGKMFHDPTAYVTHIRDSHPEVGYVVGVTFPPTKPD